MTSLYAVDKVSRKTRDIFVFEGTHTRIFWFVSPHALLFHLYVTYGSKNGRRVHLLLDLGRLQFQETEQRK
jgi:hypothetical protein